MKHIEISNDYKVLTNSGSAGSQLKYHLDNIWYKVNCVGAEGKVEEIVSRLLECSNCEDFVYYSQCVINGRAGCMSENFLCEGESLITFERLYNMFTGKSLTEDVVRVRNIQDRYEFLCKSIFEITGVDINPYLNNILCLDFITINPDRHFNNLALVTNGVNFRPAPIFDNGQGLGGNYNITPPDLNVEECCEALTANTISGSFSSQIEVLTCRELQFNDELLKAFMCSLPNSRFKSILKHRLELYLGKSISEEDIINDNFLSGVNDISCI